MVETSSPLSSFSASLPSSPSLSWVAMVGLKTWALGHCETPDTTFPFLATLPPPLNAPPYCIRSVLLPAQNAPPSSSEPVPGAPTIQWVGRPGKPLLPPHTQLGPTIPVQYNTEHRLEGIYDVGYRTHNNSQYNTLQNTD